MPRNTQNKLNSLKQSVNTIRREITPRISLSGQSVQVGTTNTNYIYIKRNVNVTAILVGGVYAVKPDFLASAIPDGAKLLSIKVIGRNCRNIRVNVPKDTALFTRGTNNTEIQDFNKENWAPLSRFPMIKIDVPDPIAAAIDTNATTVLFTLYSLDVPTAQITMALHYQTMV